MIAAAIFFNTILITFWLMKISVELERIKAQMEADIALEQVRAKLRTDQTVVKSELKKGEKAFDSTLPQVNR